MLTRFRVFSTKFSFWFHSIGTVTSHFQKLVNQNVRIFFSLYNVHRLWLISAVSYSFQLSNQPRLLLCILFFMYYWDAYNGGGEKEPKREEPLHVHCVSVSTGLYMLVSVICQRRKWVDHKNFGFLSFDFEKEKEEYCSGCF